MKIGLITDQTSCYNRTYPLLRGTWPILKNLVKEDFQITQIAPLYSSSAINKLERTFNGEEFSRKFREDIIDKTVSIITTEDESFPDISQYDAFLICHLPWDDQYWRYRPYCDGLLELIGKTDKPIIWHDADELLLNKKRYNSTYFKKWFIDKKWADRISYFLIADCNLHQYEKLVPNLKIFNAPFGYDSSLELPISNNYYSHNSRTKFINHLGPVGYREMFAIMASLFLKMSNDHNLKIHGLDKLKSYYMDEGLDAVLINKFGSQVSTEPKAFYESFENYLKELSLSAFTVHNASCSLHNENSPCYHTHRMMEGLYAGVPTLTDFYNSMPEDYFKFVVSPTISENEDLLQYVLNNRTSTLLEMRSIMKKCYPIERTVEVFSKALKGEL